MGKATAATRLDRLERLKGLLSSGEAMTQAGLAAELGISLRSLARDLAMLRESGVPIEAERGRGGGLRLQPGWSFGRLSLDREEAIDMLLSIAVAEQMSSPLLLQRLRSIRQKLAGGFSRAHQSAIRSLRTRVLVGPPASDRVVASYRREVSPATAEMKRAFLEMRLLSITYADEAGRVTAREIEPQYLYLNIPAWYLLAWDRLRQDVRFFRVDRVRTAEALDRSFRLRDRGLFLDQIGESARPL